MPLLPVNCKSLALFLTSTKLIPIPKGKDTLMYPNLRDCNSGKHSVISQVCHGYLSQENTSAILYFRVSKFMGKSPDAVCGVKIPALHIFLLQKRDLSLRVIVKTGVFVPLFFAIFLDNNEKIWYTDLHR